MPKVKKIIFFVESPFCRRDYERFGVDIIRKNGFEVEAWDFTPFLHPDLHGNVKAEDPGDRDGHKLFNTLKRASYAISRIDKDECMIVCMISYSLISYAIFRALSNNNIRYCMFGANAIPLVNDSAIMPRISRVFDKGGFGRMLNSLFLRIPHKLIGVRPAAMFLAGGSGSVHFGRFYPRDNSTKTIPIHTLDYDIYLREGKANISTDSMTGVFLDEDVCFHPEYIIRNEKPYSTAEEYFPLLRDFFDHLENRLGIKITVAAHPRSRYEDHPGYFGDRPVIKGRTIELVKKSRFVMAHNSSSINFAVLYGKPIIFITTDDLKRSPQGRLIERIASIFEKNPINLNDGFEIDLEKELAIDGRVYGRYAESYIKIPNSGDRLFWQIFSDNVKEFG
ncbi:MAG: hypothetical protein NTY76_02510 [Candidatus Omnitrophica bacterium]|nr:hypothetical protein [Candidatus Omnitrophota bacterium]